MLKDARLRNVSAKTTASKIKKLTNNENNHNIAAKQFARLREDGSAGGGWGEECRTVRAFRRAERGGYVRFRFLDLCIRFGKIISKVCGGFNSGASE